MTKALVTFAIGRYAAFLEISRPSFVAYADRHGYEYVEVEPNSPLIDRDRAPSWSKIPVLTDALSRHDAALWIDCDAIVVDGSEDIAAHVPSDSWQAMAIHREYAGSRMGEVPSCGTWFLRPLMTPFLEVAWKMTEYLNHPWWEQAAIHELMGFQHNGAGMIPVRRGAETELRRHTYFLPLEWASIDFHNAGAKARVMHMPGVTGFEERMRQMRYWSERALVAV